MNIMKSQYMAIRAVGATVLLLATVVTAAAEDKQGSSTTTLKPKAWLQAGVFYPFFNTSARLDLSAGNIGTEIDLEDDLGMESELASFSIRGGWYFANRWRLDAEYLSLNRNSQVVLSREIEWGDETYEIGARLDAFFDISIIRFAVGYDVWERDNAFIGFNIGAHLLDAKAGLAASASIGGNQGGRGIQEDVSTGGLLPVPNLGFYGSYLLSPRWRLNGRVDWFGIEVGEWDGTLVSADLQFAYLISHAWTIAAGLQYFQVDVNYDTSSWRGGLEYTYFGPRLEIGYQF